MRMREDQSSAPRAKVFISCGQSTEEERMVARAVADELEQLGFDPYIAVEEQTLKGLKENILTQIASSEYFLFIDFSREQFASSPEHRGSLFSHQELAVASFLDLDVIAFQQAGVKRLDGLIQFLQANSIPFKDPAELPALVRDQVTGKNWQPNWKNALAIEPNITYADIDIVNGDQRPARFFHLKVQNLNLRKVALNCIGHLSSAFSRTNGTRLPLLSSELRWAGSILPNIAILPEFPRLLDLGFVFKDQPNVLHFNSFSTSSRFMAPIQGPGDFELEYLVVSENFPSLRQSCYVSLGNSFGALKVTCLAKS